MSEKAPAAGASGVPEASAEAVSIDVSAVQLMARVPYPVSSVLFSVEHPAASRHADANSKLFFHSSPDRSVKDVVGIVGCFVRCREDGGMCPSTAGRITGM